MKKFLVVGGGSMGKRRIRCLSANGISSDHIRVMDLREDRRQEVKEKYAVDGFDHLNPALMWDPDAVMVCVPGALHMKVCLPAARAGKHIFCEVPLSTNLDGLDELETLAREKNIVIAPGCQVPFNPASRQIKAWLDDPAFGKPLIYHEMFGQYLPDWHPYEDYRTFYASSQKMGGGNMDVIAQELIAMMWLTGDRIESVFCQATHLSTLEIDGYDCQQILAQSAKGMAVTLQFDLIQRSGYCSKRIISEQGTIEARGTELRRYLAGTGEWENADLPKQASNEENYINEIKLFLQCIDGKAQWIVSLATAIDVVRFLQAIQESAKNKTRVEVNQ